MNALTDRQNRWEIEGSAHATRTLKTDRNPERGDHPFRVRGGKDRLRLDDDCVTNGDGPLTPIPTIHRDPPGDYRDYTSTGISPASPLDFACPQNTTDTTINQHRRCKRKYYF